MEEDFPETFPLDRFIQQGDFNAILERFENGRTIKGIKYKKELTAEEFIKQPPISDKEAMKKYLEDAEKKIDEENKEKNNNIYK
jgi:hypothetical protein